MLILEKYALLAQVYFHLRGFSISGRENFEVEWLHKVFPIELESFLENKFVIYRRRCEIVWKNTRAKYSEEENNSLLCFFCFHITEKLKLCFPIKKSEVEIISP